VSLPGGVERAYDYDAYGRLSKLTQSVGGDVLVSNYTRDDSDRIVGIRHAPSTGGSTEELAYVVDFAYRPTGELVYERRVGHDRIWVRTWGFDQAGNRVLSRSFSHDPDATAAGLIASSEDFTAGVPSFLTALSGSWAESGGVLTTAAAGETVEAELALGSEEFSRVDVRSQLSAAVERGAMEPATATAGFSLDTSGGRKRLVLRAAAGARMRLELADDASPEVPLQTSPWHSYPASGGTLTLRLLAPDQALLSFVGADGLRHVNLQVELGADHQGGLRLITHAPSNRSGDARFDDLAWDRLGTGEREWVDVVHDAGDRIQTVTTDFGGGQVQVDDYSYDSWGRIDTRARSWRVDGSIIETQNWDFDHDRRGRVTRIVVDQTTSTYTYAPGSWMRTSATVDDGTTASTTRFVWDGQSLRRVHTPGGDTQHHVGMGERLMWLDDLSGRRSIVQDGRGNVAATFGELWSYGVDRGPSYRDQLRYDAWGRSSQRTRHWVSDTEGLQWGGWGSAKDGPGYRGQWTDGETGLVFLRNRYYDPELGGFLAVDPAKAGDNWYAYAGGDPVNRWDPSGLDYVEKRFDGNETQVWYIPTYKDFFGVSRAIKDSNGAAIGFNIGTTDGSWINVDQEYGGGILNYLGFNQEIKNQNMLDLVPSKEQQPLAVRGMISHARRSFMSIDTGFDNAQALVAPVAEPATALADLTTNTIQGTTGLPVATEWSLAMQPGGGADKYSALANAAGEEGYGALGQYFFGATYSAADMVGATNFEHAARTNRVVFDGNKVAGGQELTLRESVQEAGMGGAKLMAALEAGQVLTGGWRAGRRTTTYRVEGSNTRLVIGDNGEVAVVGKGMLFLNFGDKARAMSFLEKRLGQGWADTTIKQFEVPTSFVDELRRAAVPEDLARQFPDAPIVVDTTKAADQFGLSTEQIEALRRAIIQGSGRQ